MALERFAGREALRSREAAERDELFRRTALGAESISEIQPCVRAMLLPILRSDLPVRKLQSVPVSGTGGESGRAGRKLQDRTVRVPLSGYGGGK
mmetsp:Transcript_3319/g.7821  ORF Transcript_3319/g.7821 Transcript_3319/m.7821 type:complete len:94 (+) Transcript_3319:77-358(+)